LSHQSERPLDEELALSDDELQNWERLALRGNFSGMPQPFLWQESGRFAHFLDGYKEAGGFSELSRLALAKADEARATGLWRGSAWELWLCLFFEHRAARHTGSGPANGNELCEALRETLQAIKPNEANHLSARFSQS
jgi:hypothetical protein